MSPWHLYEAFDCRLLMGIRASYKARFVLSSRCVCVQIAPCLDRDRPNVKRNFMARLRAIVLSPCDTVMCMSKLLLYYPRGVML